MILREHNGSVTHRQKIIINKLRILPTNLTQRHLMAGQNKLLCKTCATPDIINYMFTEYHKYQEFRD